MSDIDVVEKVLSDQPDLPVHIPYAGNTSPGIASFNTRDFIVEENGAVQLSKDVQGLTEEAVQAAANAKQSEQNAANSASQAKAARDEIVNNRYVERAEQAADEAERQAGYAANSAAAASQYRQGALDAANSALQSKQSAETAADEAEAALNDIVTNDYVGKAERAANDAKQSAISASNEADRAQQIADGIGSTFKPQGTIKFEELPAQPGPDYKGFLWDISNAFMTDDRFIVGAGEYAPAGSDVSCIEMADGAYKYNISAGLYDLSPYAKKTDVSEEATARQEADENLQTEINKKYTKPSSGIPESDLAQAVKDKLNKESISQSDIISVESLPTATADSPDFVQTLDGKLYRKKSSQTNGIDTTKLQGIWKLKTTSNVSGLTNFNTDMTASASAVSHAFDEDLFGFIFSGQTFNTFNYYIEEFTLYGSGTWQIKDDIEFYAAADNLSYKTELLAMMNQCYTKQTSSIITTYSYEEVGVSGNEVVDLGTLQEGSNTISSELSQKVMDESCTIVKFELSNVVGQDIYCVRSIEVTTENGVAFTFTMADDDNTIRTYGITVKGTTATLMILDINAGGTTVEFATVDECANAFNPTLMTFRIMSITYHAKINMTWRDWVNSEYNTGGFVISGANIKFSSGKYVYDEAGMVSADAIIQDKNYSNDPGGAGGTTG